jgi:Aminoacyl-tRNA editing domain
MEGASQERGIHGVDAVIDFLERHQAAYEVIEHRDTFAATSEARAAGTPPERMAKTVLLHDHDAFRIAVIPATEQLDLHKARALLEASGHLRLASEEEIEREFPAFDVGAVPPFSALLGAPESSISGCSLTTGSCAAAAITGIHWRSHPTRSNDSATRSWATFASARSPGQ